MVMLFAALALPVAALAASPPPTLSGEQFTGTFSESVGNCDTLPNPAIHYHVSGIATGPYPGTFNETGTIVISVTAPAVVPLVDVDAHFTIDSPTGQVEGDKHFVATSTGIGQCYVVTGIERLKTAKADDLEYSATIVAGTGPHDTWVDCGTSDLFFTQNTTPDMTTAFGEGFISELARPLPVRGHGHGKGRCG
jgi:hypothetical protein